MFGIDIDRKAIPWDILRAGLHSKTLGNSCPRSMVMVSYNQGIRRVRCSRIRLWKLGAELVLRDGRSSDAAVWCRSAYRDEVDPGNRNKNIGFRLSASCPPQVATANPVPDAPDFGQAGVVTRRVLVGGKKFVRTFPPETQNHPPQGMAFFCAPS